MKGAISGSGNDTLLGSDANTCCRVDTAAATASSAGAGYDQLYAATATTCSLATGSAAPPAATPCRGGAGDDTIYGGDGDPNVADATFRFRRDPSAAPAATCFRRSWRRSRFRPTSTWHGPAQPRRASSAMRTLWPAAMADLTLRRSELRENRRFVCVIYGDDDSIRRPARVATHITGDQFTAVTTALAAVIRGATTPSRAGRAMIRSQATMNRRTYDTGQYSCGQ
jgi:hypothetical protein